MMPRLTASAGTAAIQAINRIRSLKSSQIHGVYMICTAMFGNGARIGMAIILQGLLPILKALKPD